jgi:hypothetical protein
MTAISIATGKGPNGEGIGVFIPLKGKIFYFVSHPATYQTISQSYSTSIPFRGIVLN